ncbi:hypothetical protein OJ997_12065 [Solirubrobacter phytolaccae]|uniref:Uncharacterized protein n=1 Tax=Solirubrobacter phytolaccae TaxID=1404360 RepID=A0A9X3N7N1_9ACTN|nr:hypothetical protein [Solirubrobacter phytolaccae]MDA0181034.1 hypothetical protein [Solirubrobacter phytolaccae]
MSATWLEADRSALDAWLELHQLARKLPADADSAALADAALRHVIPLATELPEELPFVGVHAPTKPSPEALTPWLERLEAAQGTPASGTLLAAGVDLGLLGIDPQADERAAAVIVADFELDTVQQAMGEVGKQALLDPLVAKVAEHLADQVAEDPDRRPLLRELCKNDQALVALKHRATTSPSLALMSVYLWAVVDRYPERRAQSAKTLLMLDPHAVADVRALWGEDGPETKEHLAELLRVFHDAERRPPELDIKHASALLMADPLADVDTADPLALALRGVPHHLELPAYCAWYAAARRPGPTHRFDAWGRFAARALAPNHDVPVERAHELLELVAAELIEPQIVDGYFDAIERIRGAVGETSFDQTMTFALTNALSASEDPQELLAITFSIFAKAPNGLASTLHDEILAPAARPYRRDDDEVRAHLGPRRQAEWDEFTDRNPRPRFGRRFLPRRRAKAKGGR